MADEKTVKRNEVSDAEERDCYLALKAHENQ